MKKKTKGFLLGIACGTCLGILIAPRKGKDSRVILKKKIESATEYIKTSDSDKIKRDVLDNLYNLEKYLEGLDNAKIKEDYVKLSKKIKSEVKKLEKKVNDTASPYIKDLIDDLRNSTLVFLNKVLAKLES